MYPLACVFSWFTRNGDTMHGKNKILTLQIVGLQVREQCDLSGG
jgi:hypothetical protein